MTALGRDPFHDCTPPQSSRLWHSLPRTQPALAPAMRNLVLLLRGAWALLRNLTTSLGREEDFAKSGPKNEWLAAWGCSSLKPMPGQGNGLDTLLSTQSSRSGFIHRSEYCVAATRLEAMPSSGMSTQDAQDAQVIPTQTFSPLHCRCNILP